MLTPSTTPITNTKRQEMKRYVVILTEKEHTELCEIIGNGWGDGDFSGYAGANLATQNRAMKKFSYPINTEKGKTVKI